MEFRKIYRDSPDFSRVDILNLEAFPVEERLPSSLMASLCEEGELDLLGVYDGDLFVGFCCVMPGEEMSYVFFLAVDGSARSKGYGTIVLDMLRQRYPSGQIVLDIEPLVPECDNLEQRKRRKGFYLRNGFSASGWFFKYCGLCFELMFAGGETFDREAYMRLLDRISVMVVKSGFTGFDPVVEKNL